MNSTANLQTDTLGVPPKFGDQPCPPPCDDLAELRDWLDMLGLPPCERPLRTSRGERNRAGVYGEDK